jgi:hypothetical protein
MKVYDEIIDFFASKSSTNELLDFKPSPTAMRRVRELISLEKESKITESEKVELDDFMKLEHLMRLTKARARKYAQAG